MLTFKKLQIFSAIAHRGNLTAAAEEVFLSKGAVSQALAELESDLGVSLFDRVHPRLQLNEQGRQLQPLADEMLGRMHDIENLFAKDSALQGQLRLGASQTIGNYLLPDLLCQLDGVQTHVTIKNTQELCNRLSRFELDMALIEGQNRLPDLVTEHWLDDEMYLVVSTSHPLATAKSIKLSALNGQNWVLRETNSGSREQFDKYLAPVLENSGQVTELNTLESVMKAVEVGMGITLISAHAVADRLLSGKLKRLHVEQRFMRPLSLIWHKQKYHSALLRHFIELCRNKRM